MCWCRCRRWCRSGALRRRPRGAPSRARRRVGPRRVGSRRGRPRSTDRSPPVVGRSTTHSIASPSTRVVIESVSSGASAAATRAASAWVVRTVAVRLDASLRADSPLIALPLSAARAPVMSPSVASRSSILSSRRRCRLRSRHGRRSPAVAADLACRRPAGVAEPDRLGGRAAAAARPPPVAAAASRPAASSTATATGSGDRKSRTSRATVGGGRRPRQARRLRPPPSGRLPAGDDARDETAVRPADRRRRRARCAASESVRPPRVERGGPKLVARIAVERQRDSRTGSLAGERVEHVGVAADRPRTVPRLRPWRTGGARALDQRRPVCSHPRRPQRRRRPATRVAGVRRRRGRPEVRDPRALRARPRYRRSTTSERASRPRARPPDRRSGERDARASANAVPCVLGRLQCVTGAVRTGHGAGCDDARKGDDRIGVDAERARYRERVRARRAPQTGNRVRAAVRANCHRDGVVAGVGDRIARHADLKRRADRPQCRASSPAAATASPSSVGRRAGRANARPRGRRRGRRGRAWRMSLRSLSGCGRVVWSWVDASRRFVATRCRVVSVRRSRSRRSRYSSSRSSAASSWVYVNSSSISSPR